MPELINHPNADPGKTFWAVAAPLYRTTGIPTHLGYDFIAVSALKAAMANGCEDVVVEVKGMRPQRYTLEQIKDLIRRDPRKWLLLFWRSPSRELMIMALEGLL